MAWGVRYLCPNTTPKVVSEASVDMWKGNFQLGPFKIGASETFFKVSKAFWLLESQLNSQS